ncbi:hypothetical protein AC249_AIPGENE17200, partial [Exaiptasia diaphana]
ARNTPVVNPDIDNLVSAVTFGKGMRPSKNSKQKLKGSADSVGKMSSSVKSELKASTSSHPYASNRP